MLRGSYRRGDARAVRVILVYIIRIAVTKTMGDEQPGESSFMSAVALSRLTLRLRRGMG